MFLKRPKPKSFEYIPRFYNPEEDPEEKLKRKLGFSRKRKFKRKGRNPLFWLILIIIVIYLYLKFNRLI